MGAYPKLLLAQWKPFGQNLVNVVGPIAASVGVPAAMWSAVTAAFDAFGTAYDAAAERATRTEATIQTCKDRLDDFRKALRPVVAVLQANPAVENSVRRQLGLRVRDDVASPAPVPTTKPVLAAAITGADSLRVIVDDPADPNRRGKPATIKSIAVHTHRGAMPPSDSAEWALNLLSSRKTADLSFPNLADVATVWVSACYVNTRNERGPMSDAVRVRLPGSGLAPVVDAAVPATPAMKIAA